MERLKNLITLSLSVALAILSGCRGDELVIPAEYERVEIDLRDDPFCRGIYLLNEGNMGSNKASLDYLDFTTGVYGRNIYGERNPSVAKELGDVGNDIGIYGSKLYMVINCSHKVEVVDSRSGVRIGQVDIPNCRRIKFYEGKAYVSAYLGEVSVGLDSPKGAVYEIDTLSLAITRKVTVGYQPEDVEIHNGQLYVANSGGYRPPEYDNTVSQVRLSDFKQVRQIEVGRNPGKMLIDNYGRLWVSSRGDNSKAEGKLQMLQPHSKTGNMEVALTLDIAVGNMAIHGNKLFFICSSGADGASYGVIDILTGEKISDGFITDGTDREIAVPYGLHIMEESGNILLTDAKNYVSSGTLYCFSPEGRKLWSVRTGDIPAHITCLKR